MAAAMAHRPAIAHRVVKKNSLSMRLSPGPKFEKLKPAGARKVAQRYEVCPRAIGVEPG
jgi:hypothetical protein